MVEELVSAGSDRHRSKPSFVALDRDGTVIRYVPYLSRIGQMELIQGSAEAIARLNSLNIPVYLVTNQSVIGRGILSEEELINLHAHLVNELARGGAFLDGICFCPHLPTDECKCRKPRTGMLECIAHQLGVSINSGLVIGDSLGDIQMGQIAGCEVLHVQTGVNTASELPKMVASCDSLVSAIGTRFGT